MKNLFYCAAIILLFAFISCEKLNETLEPLQVDSLNYKSNNNLDIPKNGLQFHGLADNYDFIKGIWYDANSTGNNFSTFWNKYHPFKYVNGKLLNIEIPDGCSQYVDNSKNLSKYPYIRTYRNAYFKLSKALGTGDDPNCTFIAVVKPIKFYNNEVYNPIITEKDNQTDTNHNFTHLRYDKYRLRWQQRGIMDNYITKDTHLGYTIGNTNADFDLQLLVGIIKGDDLFLYKNGELVAYDSRQFRLPYIAEHTSIGGVLSANYDVYDNLFFDGAIFEVMIYDRAISTSELLKINNYFQKKYELL